MKVPSIDCAVKILSEAEKLNPGAWVEHNKIAGMCARKIASKCIGLDENVAYVLGLLHDIGRRDGEMEMRHILSGYNFMISQGYDDSARICLTHSFPYKNVGAYNGENDCNPSETDFIQSFITNIEYNDYDRLIQFCDAISFPNGPTYIEKRLVDVVLRRGFNELTIPKWKSLLEIKQYFDNKINGDIYELLLGRVSNAPDMDKVNDSMSDTNEDKCCEEKCIDESKLDKVQDIWIKAIEMLKCELTEISFNTWIKTIKPIKIKNSKLYLAVPSEFNKGILESRYYSLIKKTIQDVNGEAYELDFSVIALNQSNYSIEKHDSQAEEESRSVLNSNYSFDTLVVGEHNQMAFKSAMEVAKDPFKGSRLLYIYGGVGIGKTHILHAIGNYIMKFQPEIRVKYISIDDFLNEMIQAIKCDSQQNFRNRFLKNDVLLFDNLQNIAGKERTQEEFYKIIRSIMEEGKQVVISCTKAPQDIFIMDERFTSLFDIGGIYEISNPSQDTRIELIQRKADSERLQFSDEIIEIMSNAVSLNIRELLSAVNMVISYSKLKEEHIDTDMVRRILSNF